MKKENHVEVESEPPAPSVPARVPALPAPEDTTFFEDSAKTQKLLDFLVSDKCGISKGLAARYASKLVELGVEGVDDLARLDEGDLSSCIGKKLHIKRIKEALGIE